MNTDRKISVITPTHNRIMSLQRLLEGIARQVYPSTHIEMIVVCDGCTDDTVAFLKNYESDFSLKYIEQPGLGAANARNHGAAMATGELLIFLDDDIEPAPELVQAHVDACDSELAVVVGYLPMELKRDAGFYQILLTRWWEDKYHDMGQPGYRHQFEDLLSGNFSLPTSLFHKVGGFNSSFRCREDYELGYRLVHAGARIRFCKKAWGYHRDEVTNQARSHKRKRMEGYWDVAMAKLHPEIIQRLRMAEMRHPTKGKKLKMFVAFHLPFITDTMAYTGRFMMGIFERMKMRRLWQQADKKLHAYWYMRGVGDHVKNVAALRGVFLTEKIPHYEYKEVDISKGVEIAALELDQLKAEAVRLHFNGKLIGKMVTRPGEEIIQGKDLVWLLSDRYAWEMMEALAMQDICHTKTLSR